MKNKTTMTVFSVAILLTFGATNSVFANDCNPCAVPAPPPKPVAVNCNPCAVPPPPPKPVAINCNPCAVPPPPPKPVAVNCNPCAVPVPLPKPVVANTCTSCATTTNVSYHPVQSGTFHERIVPKDAKGNPLACLDISGSSVKVGVDWSTATNNVFTSGVHTTKYNSATVVEERYQ